MAGYANKPYVNELLNLGPDDYQALGFYLPSLDGMDKYGADPLRGPAQEGPGLRPGHNAAQSENFVRTMMTQSKKETWTGTKYRVFTLNDMLSQVQQIVNVLNSASLVILLILFLIIMVGIRNTFRIIMYERIREIGTMRSIGMQRGEVRSLFLYEASFLSLGGVVAGLLLALLVMGVRVPRQLRPQQPPLHHPQERPHDLQPAIRCGPWPTSSSSPPSPRGGLLPGQERRRLDPGRGPAHRQIKEHQT